VGVAGVRVGLGGVGGSEGSGLPGGAGCAGRWKVAGGVVCRGGYPTRVILGGRASVCPEVGWTVCVSEGRD